MPGQLGVVFRQLHVHCLDSLLVLLHSYQLPAKKTNMHTKRISSIALAVTCALTFVFGFVGLASGLHALHVTSGDMPMDGGMPPGGCVITPPPTHANALPEGGSNSSGNTDGYSTNPATALDDVVRVPPPSYVLPYPWMPPTSNMPEERRAFRLVAAIGATMMLVSLVGLIACIPSISNRVALVLAVIHTLGDAALILWIAVSGHGLLQNFTIGEAGRYGLIVTAELLLVADVAIAIWLVSSIHRGSSGEHFSPKVPTEGVVVGHPLHHSLVLQDELEQLPDHTDVPSSKVQVDLVV